MPTPPCALSAPAGRRPGSPPRVLCAVGWRPRHRPCPSRRPERSLRQRPVRVSSRNRSPQNRNRTKGADSGGVSSATDPTSPPPPRTRRLPPIPRNRPTNRVRTGSERGQNGVRPRRRIDSRYAETLYLESIRTLVLTLV